MNPEKLKNLQEQVRIGGKGTARRKKKVVHRTSAGDERKLNTTLKKLGMNAIPGIEEVNMFKDDGQVLHFTNPKVQALLPANSFAVTGHPETKALAELLPSVLSQLGTDGISGLKQLAESLSPSGQGKAAAIAEEGDDDDDDVPELTENFDEASKND